MFAWATRNCIRTRGAPARVGHIFNRRFSATSHLRELDHVPTQSVLLGQSPSPDRRLLSGKANLVRLVPLTNPYDSVLAHNVRTLCG